MKMLAVHTCPLWQDPNGQRRPGMCEEDPPPPTVGWVNVAVIEFGSETRLLLLVDA